MTFKLTPGAKGLNNYHPFMNGLTRSKIEESFKLDFNLYYTNVLLKFRDRRQVSLQMLSKL